MLRTACFAFFSLTTILPAQADPAATAERASPASPARALRQPPTPTPKPQNIPSAGREKGARADARLLDPYPASPSYPGASDARAIARASNGGSNVSTAKSPSWRVTGQPIDPYRPRGPVQAKQPIDPYRGDRGDDQGLPPRPY